jgi:hypothetical protein
MSRRRSKRKTTEESSMSEDTKEGVSGTTLDALSGMLLAPSGHVRARPLFTVDDPHARVPIAFRQVIPFAAIRGGFRLEAEDSTNDTAVEQINYDPSGIDGTSYFHPRLTIKADIENNDFEAATPLAHTLVQRIWPHYDRLFRTSLKQAGTDVPFNSFIAVTCLTVELHSLLMDVRSYLMLSNPMGIKPWDELSNLFGQSYNLFNRSLTRRFEAIVELASGFPAMRGMTMETKRIKSPFMPTTANGSITIPLEAMMTSANSATRTSTDSIVSDILTRCELITNVLRSSYADEMAAMKRHMPYTLGDADFMGALPIVPDPFKTDGLMNSAISLINVSGNEDDAGESNTFTLEQDASEVGFLPFNFTMTSDPINVFAYVYTVFPQSIPFGSIMSMELYVEDSDATDKEFALLTPHQFGYAAIPHVNDTYDGIDVYYQSNYFIAQDNGLVREALCMQLGGVMANLWLPDGEKVNPDVDAILSNMKIMMDAVCDLHVVSGIDRLAQTSGAPVVNPAVHSLRS